MSDESGSLLPKRFTLSVNLTPKAVAELVQAATKRRFKKPAGDDEGRLWGRVRSQGFSLYLGYGVKDFISPILVGRVTANDKGSELRCHLRLAWLDVIILSIMAPFCLIGGLVFLEETWVGPLGGAAVGAALFAAIAAGLKGYREDKREHLQSIVHQLFDEHQVEGSGGLRVSVDS